MILVLIILSAITSLAGYGAFVCFLVLLNYEASLLAFATGLTASLLFVIHWLKYRNKIGEYYQAQSLRSIAHFGFVMFAIGLSRFTYNTIIFAVLHPPILPVRQSIILSVVWSFLAFKNGAMLCWYGRKYAQYVLIDRTKLLESPSSSSSSSAQQVLEP